MGWKIRTLLIFFLSPLGIFRDRKSLFESPYQINEHPWDSVTAFVVGREESGGTMALKRQHGGERACVKTTHLPPLSMCLFHVPGAPAFTCSSASTSFSEWRECASTLWGRRVISICSHALWFSGTTPLSVFLLRVLVHMRLPEEALASKNKITVGSLGLLFLHQELLLFTYEAEFLIT